MNIVDSDERDSTWEEHSSLFRVYFATVPDGAVRTMDVSDFGGFIRWAVGAAGLALFISGLLVRTRVNADIHARQVAEMPHDAEQGSL